MVSPNCLPANGRRPSARPQFVRELLRVFCLQRHDAAFVVFGAARQRRAPREYASAVAVCLPCFLTRLTDELVNRFLLATVPERIPAESEHRPCHHSGLA